MGLICCVKEIELRSWCVCVTANRRMVNKEVLFVESRSGNNMWSGNIASTNELGVAYVEHQCIERMLISFRTWCLSVAVFGEPGLESLWIQPAARVGRGEASVSQYELFCKLTGGGGGAAQFKGRSQAGEMTCGYSACFTTLRTWVQIPRTHITAWWSSMSLIPGLGRWRQETP